MRSLTEAPALSVTVKVAKYSPVSSLVGFHEKTPLTESNLAVESVRTFYRADRYRATFQLTKNGA